MKKLKTFLMLLSALILTALPSVAQNRSRVQGCAGCLRLTIGTPEENDRLLQSLATYEKSHLH